MHAWSRALGRAALCGVTAGAAATATAAAATASASTEDNASSATPKVVDDGVTVERVVVWTRHGDRTPVSDTNQISGHLKRSSEELDFFSGTGTRLLCPGPELKDEWRSYCPYTEEDVLVSKGRLTYLGAATQQANGQWLRERYVHRYGLLGRDLVSSEVHARSTPFPRCIQSAQNLLLGLYPPRHRPAPASADGQTPVQILNAGLEPMYGAWFCNRDSCPRMIQLLHELYEAQDRWISPDDRALEARVQTDTGSNPNSNLKLADAIRCQQQYGLPLAAGWSPAYATQVRDYAWRTFMARYTQPEFLSLMMSQLVPEFLGALEAGGPKLTVFAGHDACPMMPVLVACGVWDGSWPDYASLLVFEVVSVAPHVDRHSHTRALGDPAPAPGAAPAAGGGEGGEGGGAGGSAPAGHGRRYVRCLFNGEERRIRGCSRPGDGLCPLESFQAILRQHELPDLDRACEARTGPGSAFVSDTTVEAGKGTYLRGEGGLGSERHEPDFAVWRGMA